MKIALQIMALLATLTIQHMAFAACSPCSPFSGCEPSCIDNHTCSCGVGGGGGFSGGPGCTQSMSAYWLQSTANANSNLDWDLTASFPGFSLTPANGCPGYAICESSHTGSGDTWQRPYTTGDGHVHWNVGAEGNGTATTSTINAWPIIGTGYSTEPFGCGSNCNIQAIYTSEQAVPGQGLVVSGPVPNVTPTNSFNCVFAREGDLGLSAPKGGIGALYQGSSVVVSADNPTGGDSAYSYITLLSLYRPSGPFPITSVSVSPSSGSTLLSTNCRAAGFVQIYSNDESLTWSGNSVFLHSQPSGEVTEGMCLLNQ